MYTIVALSPPEIQAKFDLLKNKLVLLHREIKTKDNNLILKELAHFAIKRTFTLKDGIAENTLISKLDELKYSSVAINSNQVGSFEKSNYGAMVFLKLEISEELKSLHYKIKELINNDVNTKNPEHEGEFWLPHITFSYDTQIEKLPEIKSTVEKELLPINFNLDSLYLLKEFDMTKDERKIIKIINLKK